VNTFIRDFVRPLTWASIICGCMYFFDFLTPNTPMGYSEVIFGALIGTIVGYLFLFCIWEFFPVLSLERIIEKIRESVFVCRTLQVMSILLFGIFFYWFFSIGIETDNPDRIAFTIAVSIFCGMTYGGTIGYILRKKFFPSVKR